MTALREHIGLAQASLWEISKHFDEADTAQDRKAALQALCVQSEASLTKATQELKSTQHELGRVQAELKARNAVLEDQRNRSNQELDQRIASAQGQWSALQARLEKARRELVEVDASLGSLHKRLHLG